MNQPLLYVREILAGHTESKFGKEIYSKLTNSGHDTEEYFVRSLSGEEMYYLNSILAEAIDYANQEKDDERSRQLNAVYELLTI
ncbi:sporulation protein [Peribacillus glennii]|uniref:Sporulation protein n=1 Tax=Peribacillus glennii TaxID=2303991 RepID=A0A372L960_9BACI|nr:sporulation protein [Peribacillus glennii]RFU62080.1 sporulation protein [Peribacillus glennii]